MNICLVSQFYPPDTGGGGIAAYVYYLAHALVRRGHRIFVISKMGLDSREISEDGSLTVIRIRQWNPSNRASRVPFIGKHMRAVRNLFYSLAVRRQVEKLSRRTPLDIVEYADIEGEGFRHTGKVGIPYVVKLHTPYFALEPYYSESEFGFSTAIIKRLEEKVIRRANAITSPSRTLAKLVSDQYGLPLDRIRYVPNGIDTEIFCPTPSNPQSERSVLYVGRLEPRKGAEVFMQSIPRILQRERDVRFIFLGADRRSANGESQRDEIVSFLTEHGVNGQVVFQDHADRSVFLDYYSKATICVIPSLFENCPYTLLEAMACGKAVVASDSSGLAEIIHDGENGMLFDTGSPQSLADKVLALLASPELCALLGEAARRCVLENYAAGLVASLTENLYLEVLRSN